MTSMLKFYCTLINRIAGSSVDPTAGAGKELLQERASERAAAKRRIFTWQSLSYSLLVFRLRTLHLDM
jgi:hypothetical protein